MDVRVRAGFVAAILAALIASSSSPARSQNMRDIMGGFIAAAQQQSARESWARVPPPLRACLDRALQAAGASLPQVMAGGVPIGHPQLAPVVADCARFDEARLQQRFKCTVPDETGTSVATTCVQSFAQPGPDGRPTPLTASQAMDVHFSRRGQVVLVEVEAEEARRERQGRAQRAEQVQRLAELQTELAPFEGSPLPRTRAATARLKARMERAARDSTADVAVDAFARDIEALKRLADEEEVEKAALDRLKALDAEAHARTRGDLPEALRSRLADLNTRYKALVAVPEIRPSPPPKKPQDRKVGPSFDCGTSDSPLKTLICGSQALAQADLDILRAYYAARHALPAEVEVLKETYIELARKASADCRVSEKASTRRGSKHDPAACVLKLYREQTKQWVDLVGRSGPPAARQELTRPIREHIDLQEQLQALGFLPTDATIDGIYGSTTRRAIAAFQSSVGLEASGYMSAPTSAAIAVEVARGTDRGGPPDASRATAMRSLHQDYARYLSELTPIERGRQIRETNLAKLRDQRAVALKLVDQPIGEDLRAFLRGFVPATSQDVDIPDADVIRLGQEFERWKPRIDAATRIVNLINEKNRVVFVGDGPDDLLILYNTAPRSRVTRGLTGNLVFEPKVDACILAQAPPDRIAGIALGDVLRRIGLAEPPVPQPCTTDQFEARDLVIVQRSALIRQPFERVKALANGVGAGNLSLAATVLDADVRATRNAEVARATEVEAAVEARQEGAAALLLDNEARAVCQVSSGPVHDRSFERVRARLNEEGKETLEPRPMSPEEAFLAVKRSQCRAIFGSLPALAQLIVGLERDGISFRYLPVLISAADLQADARAIAQEQAAAEEARIAARQKRAQEAAREEVRRASDRLAAIADRMLADPTALDAAVATVMNGVCSAYHASAVYVVLGTPESFRELTDCALGSRPGGHSEAALQGIGTSGSSP